MTDDPKSEDLKSADREERRRKLIGRTVVILLLLLCAAYAIPMFIR